MLGLFEEALVQYDELDALFSQFVVNGVTSECVSWLSNFQKPLERWHGLKFGCSILSDTPSVLELRAYLFAKQAHMLLLINKVWEVSHSIFSTVINNMVYQNGIFFFKIKFYVLKCIKLFF